MFKKAGVNFLLGIVLFPLIVYTQSSQVLINFENKRDWNMVGNAINSSKYYVSTEEGPDSITVYVGRLEYGFLTPGNDYLELSSDESVSGTIKKIRLWVYGDKKGALLKILWKDTNDETFIMNMGKIDWNGWKLIETDFRFEEYYGGDNNGILNYPIIFNSFLIEDDPNDEIVNGTIFLGNLEVIYERPDEGGKKEVKEQEQKDFEKRKGVFFSGLASMIYHDIDTSGSTNYDQYKYPIIRQSYLQQYFDLTILGQLYDEASVSAKIRVEKGPLGWAGDRKEDFYNTEYTKTGVELEKMEIKGEPLGIKNRLVIGKINPLFSTYSLAKTLYGAQWDVQTGGFKSTIVGARPKSSLFDKNGLYAVDSKEYNVYLLGIRESYKIQDMQFSGSLVNLHRNNGVFVPLKNFLRGDRATPIQALYIKVGDSTPNSDYGANMYNLKFYENGIQKYDLTPTVNDDAYVSEEFGDTGKTTFAGGYRYTKFDSYFIYRIPLSQNITNIQIDIDLKNGYKVELSADGITWVTVLSYPTDVTAELANQGVRNIRIHSDNTIDVNDGGSYIATGETLDINELNALSQPTGKTILEFDIIGKVLDTKIHAEFNQIYEHRIYTDSSRKERNLGYATFINLQRRFYWANVIGEVFDISPEYDTSYDLVNTVDSDDDRDGWPDHWQYETVNFVDENRNGIPDDEERPPYKQVGIYVTRDYFDLIVDEDHNDVRDDRQDDGLPDYIYKINQVGYKLQTFLDPVKDIIFKLGYKDIKTKKGKLYDNEIQVGIEYTTKIPKFGKIIFYNDTKKIRDIIPDNLAGYTNVLNYKNNLLNTSIASFNFLLLFGIQLHGKLQYIVNMYNKQERIIQNAESILQVSKEIPLISKLSFTPILFSRVNKDVSKARSPFIVYQYQIEKNISDHRSIFELAYRLSDSSKIFVSGQYGVYYDFRDSLNRYNVTTFSTGALGTDVNSFQYGVEYRREMYDYMAKEKAAGVTSSFYGMVAYRF